MKLSQLEISELYVALFNRASEGDGNEYWLERSDILSKVEIANEIIDSPAAQTYFGESLNVNQLFIEHIYENTLAKTIEDDPEGIAFWTAFLDQGRSRGEVVVHLLEVLKSEESLHENGDLSAPLVPHAVIAQQQFENRVLVSNAMADKLQSVDVLNEDGSVNQQKFTDMLRVSSFTANDLKGSLHTTQAEEGVNGLHGELKDVTGKNQLYVTEKDATKDDAITSIANGHFVKYGEVIALTNGKDAITSHNVVNGFGAGNHVINVLSRYDDVIDAETITGSLQLTDVIIDPSTQDNDRLEVELSSSLGNDAFSGVRVENIEQFTLHASEAVSVINTSEMIGVVNLNINREDTNFDKDGFEPLEVVNLDGEHIRSVNAIDRTRFLSVSDLKNDAKITLNKDFLSLQLDASVKDGKDEATVYLEGANFELSLFDDAMNTQGNNGEQFDSITLISHVANSRVTLAEGTSLNNITDRSSKGITAVETKVAIAAEKEAELLLAKELLETTQTSWDALNDNANEQDKTEAQNNLLEARQAVDVAIQAYDEAIEAIDNAATASNNKSFDLNKEGRDVTGIEGSMQTISSATFNNNSLLTQHLLLDSEGGNEDIILIGTGLQFDEAVIEEVYEPTKEEVIAFNLENKEVADNSVTLVEGGLNSIIELTISGEKEVSKTGVGAGVDLTRAEVDLIKVKALGANALVAEFMEIDVDEETRVEVNEITALDTLVITGDHRFDRLEVDLNTGNTKAAQGRLVLGGDASATTTDFISNQSNQEDIDTGDVFSPDLEVQDAVSATLVIKGNSHLGLLDVSKIGSTGVIFEGSSDVLIDTLLLGQGSLDINGDYQAPRIDATAHKGNFEANLSIAGRANNEGDLSKQLHDEGNGKEVGQLENIGRTVKLGSGDDVLGNVGIVSGGDGTDDLRGWVRGDNITLGAGDDVVKIGSQLTIDNKETPIDDAVAVQIWGEEGSDHFVFQSIADTDRGAHANGHQFDFISKDTETGIPIQTGNSVVDNPESADQTGTSLVQIKDFDAGEAGDQLVFNLFRDIDGTGDSLNDHAATATRFHPNEIISATSTNNYLMKDGSVVLVSVDDLSTITADSIIAMFGDSAVGQADSNNDDSVVNTNVGSIPAVFEDPDANNTGESNFYEYIILVGEEQGNQGVKIFYVREGGNTATDIDSPTVDHIEANLIGSITNIANDINITVLTEDNFIL